jgi:hypothetical protein
LQDLLPLPFIREGHGSRTFPNLWIMMSSYE